MNYVKNHPIFQGKNVITLRVQMLTGKLRQKVIRHKAIFQKTIMIYASCMPDPTKENSIQELSHRLIDARDRFFVENPKVPRREMVEAAWKILIEEVEHNDEYRSAWYGLIKVIKEL